MAQGSTIDITSDTGQDLRAYLTQPPQGSGPGLVLVHETFGLSDFMHDMADRLAAEGYVCLVPERPAPLDADHSAASDAQALAEIIATATALSALPGYRGKLGIIGWRRADLFALLATARHGFACAVCYDGVGLDRHSEELADLNCPLLLQLGDADPSLPAVTRQALATASSTYPHIDMQVYGGCGQRFWDPIHANYDKPAAMMAYSRTVALLRHVLGPVYDLSRLWDAHTFHEFASRDVDATMATMATQPYVNHIPTMTGGVGYDHLKRFYTHHFVNSNPPDTRLIPVSRTVGADRLVDEMVFCFTHTCEIPWMLPGIPPSGRYVEIPLVVIVNFCGDKLYHEHIYWDQASVLVQIGALDPQGLPVAGIATAKKLLDETLPSNELMGAAWTRSGDLPL